MKSKEKPYVLYVAEKIYLEISEIKKKITIVQISMRLMNLLGQGCIKK